MRSLRTKVAVFVAALFLVSFALLATISTKIAYVDEHMVVAPPGPAPLHGLSALDNYYARQHTWRNVRALLARLARANNRQLLLTGARGEFVDSSDAAIKAVETRRDAQGGFRFDLRYSTQGEVRVGNLQFLRPAYAVRSGRGVAGLVFPLLAPQALPARESLVAFNRKLLLAFGVIGAVSVLCGLLLAQYLLEPIAKLSAGAERLRRGDYDRISVDRNDEVGNLGRILNALSSELARAQREREGLIADIAHELRSPLTNIRCAVEEIQDGLVKPTPGDLQSLHDEVLHLQRLIEDLHDLSMADAHAFKLETRALDIRAEIDAALTASAKQFDLKRVAIVREFPKVPVMVQADASRLKQIMANLLSNALRATAEESVVRVSISSDRASAHVTVEDSGQGFDPANSERLFERFYREEASRSRETGGSGLGLALTRQLVVAHGGTISAANTGHGARFTFSIPLA